MRSISSTHEVGELSEPVVGNLFVSVYPPFSSWKPQSVVEVERFLQTVPSRPDNVPLGLYIHLPFCLERCRFCYYRSFAGQSSETIDKYLDALSKELTLYGASSALANRRPEFVYFGGGTPSSLSAKQLERLFQETQEVFPWSDTKEVTLECAPKTVTRERLEVMKTAGITRVSMGVQQLSDRVLQKNGRVHLVSDVRRAYAELMDIKFDVVNFDLMTGLVGETDRTFFDSLEQVIDMSPDSVTLYQLEVPTNTPLYRDLCADKALSLPSWDIKRSRQERAFLHLEAAGYTVRSAYAAVRDPARHPFVYQEAQYHGADLLGVGVASFSYLSGIHFQNTSSHRDYLASLDDNRVPCARAYQLSEKERMVREFSLQCKLGSIDLGYFRNKFGVEVVEQFACPLTRFANQGWLTIDRQAITLTRQGLLHVDRMIPAFFLPKHQDVSYW